MSTRAERRLKEAQGTHQAALDAQKAADDEFARLREAVSRGEEVDPAEFAAADGAVKLRAVRVQRTSEAVEAEQATVDEERARARHKELVEAAEATQVDLDTTDIRQAMEELLRRAYAVSDAHYNLRSAVRAEYGEIPFIGSGNTAPNGVVATGPVKLDGVSYLARDPYRLVRDLRDMVGRVFEGIRYERDRARFSGEQPVSWQAQAVSAGVRAAREDEQRYKPTGPDQAA